MLFGQDRGQLRQFYCAAWAAHRTGEPLDPLQTQIVSVIQQHPEYHALLEKPDAAMQREYLPESGESNPFLHMGMHLAIQEQIATDRPVGIRRLYASLLAKDGDPHELEHRMMECLAEMLWQAQRGGEMPDEKRYQACIEALERKS
jgi:hypothetical protein